MEILEFLLIGLAAGWMIGTVRTGNRKGHGLIKSLFVGVIGSFMGWFLMGFLQVESETLLNRFIMAVLGSATFFFLLGLFSGKKKKKSEEEDE